MRAADIQVKSLSVLTLVLTGFALHSVIHLEPAIVAPAGSRAAHP